MLSTLILRNSSLHSRLILANRRLLHTTFSVRKDEKSDPISEKKGTTDDEHMEKSEGNVSDDTLKHLYKKKYRFIQKQNLEDSYNQLNEIHNKQSNNYGGDYGNYSNDSASSDEKTFQLTQKLKLLAASLLAVSITIGGLQVYKNWTFIKSKYLGDTELETFDEMYERIKQKRQKKQEALEKFSTKISNPNDSSVPGVYICGDNQSHLITDNSYDYVPVFKRLDVFDNFIVKYIVIGDNSGALINDKGDLYQWGDGFNGDSTKPTIKGEKLLKVQISNGVVYALTGNGEVLYLPEDYKLQKEISEKRKGWLHSYSVNYCTLKMPRKDIVDIAAGLQHLVLLDKSGSVFTTATGFNMEINKSYGQFGLPEYSQFDEPPKINDVHDVVLINKYMKAGKVLHRNISKIAAGDYFTLCLDKSGALWAFGKNTHGAIGTLINYDTEIIPYPTQIKISGSHFKRSEYPRCTDIAAGGDTAYATFMSSNIYELFEKSIRAENALDNRFIFEPIPDEEKNNLHLSWGHGLKGELGLGYFIHGSHEPKKIKTLNDIKEFNEETEKLEKIGVKSWSIGKNHAIVTLENNDVYVWGDNEYGQLGNGKRIRTGSPSNIPSLLEPEADKKMKFSKFNNRLQLFDNGKFHQEIVAGRYTSAIVYKKN